MFQPALSNKTSTVIEHLDTAAGAGQTAAQAVGPFVDYLLGSLSGDNTLRQNAVSKVAPNTASDGGSQVSLQSATKGPRERIRDEFEAAAQTAIDGVHDHGADVLGAVYMQCDLGKESFAQNFTPRSVAQFMVQSTVSEEDLEAMDGTPLSTPVKMCDPCCGSGIFLVELANRLRQAENPPPALIIGQDIDHTAAKMSAVNMALHGIPGYVIAGDTLLNQSDRVWGIAAGLPLSSNVLVRELPSETFPDGVGSIPNGSFDHSLVSDLEEREPPDDIGDTPYEHVARSTDLIEAYIRRLDPENGSLPP